MCCKFLQCKFQLLKIRLAGNQFLLVLLIDVLDYVEPHVLARLLAQKRLEHSQLLQSSTLRQVLLTDLEVDIGDVEH
jgi:hypothetical protein